jgi:hypothetical protein
MAALSLVIARSGSISAVGKGPNGGQSSRAKKSADLERFRQFRLTALASPRVVALSRFIRSQFSEQILKIKTRVARYLLVQHTKTGIIYQRTIKYTKWPQNLLKSTK